MRLRAWILITTAAIISGGTTLYWSNRDPAPAIAEELNRAIAAPSDPVPYADLIRHEHAAAGHLKSATFAAPCFWSGEGRLGLEDGVYRTTPGYFAGQESVRVDYDPEVVSYETLKADADPDHVLSDETKEAVCRFNAAESHASKADGLFHPDDQPKWYIQQTAVRFIPMTPAQATRINAWLHLNRDIESLLSPGQNALLKRVRANPKGDWKNEVGVPLP